MLELYHGDPGANSGKPMMTLKEKGVEFVSHYLNLPNFDQHKPEYLKINPKGQAPTLVHDGVVITESTQMCEYIDEAFEGAPLRPANPHERWRMRTWNKYMDQEFGTSLSMIAWSRFIGPMNRHRSAEELKAIVERVPDAQRRATWATAICNTFTREQLDESMRRLAAGARRLEERLRESAWLAGPSFSLADIIAFNLASPMPALFSELVNPNDTPHVYEWLAKIRARPEIAAALAMDRGSLAGAGRPAN